MNEDQNNNHVGSFVDQNQSSAQPQAQSQPQAGREISVDTNTQNVIQPVPRKSSKKIWLIIIVLLVILGIVAYFFGPRIYLVYKAKNILFSESKTPMAYIIPESRSLDSSLKPSSTCDIKASGLAITAPWSGPATTKENGMSGSYVFSNNKKILITKDENNQSVQNVVNESKGAYIKDELGSDKFSTAYTATETMLNLSPVNLTISEKTQKLAAEITLLDIKSIISYKADKIYSYSSGDLMVFQFGSASGTELITLGLYNKQGKHINDIGIAGATQQEIDYIISHAKFF